MDKQSRWNGAEKRNRIFRRIRQDCIAGIFAAFSAAPIIMAVDKAVVQKTSGTATFTQSFKDTFTKLLKTPHRFIFSREFAWIFLVYSSTYCAANSIDSLCKINNTSDVIPKLIGVTAVNMTASILKDRAFAYYYGKKVSNPVGAISILLWLFRDVLTMAGAFVLPSRVAKLLQERKMEENKAKKITQFALPMSFQLVLTPFHLLGYDFYNYKDRSFSERVAYLSPQYISTVGVRMIRMGAAYGIGGVNNIRFRNYFISKYEGEDWDKSY
jgi:hypothetical protein